MSEPAVLDPGYTTPEMAVLWTASARTRAILDFEAALALALADAGITPPDEAEEVASACATGLDDPESAWASTWESGTPLLAILEEIRGRVGDDRLRRWLHHGATTQDAIDTAHMLQASRSLALLESGLGKIARRMASLMDDHRHQPQMGRTFLQHARATTFGFRVALWLDTVLGRLEELAATRVGLPVQLGGPVGDRSDYGAAAADVVDALARRLSLVSTPVSWHGDRSPIWALTGLLRSLSGALSKIAMDVALFASSDIAEVTVRSAGSSSMPGKHNPLDAMRATAAAAACHGAATMIEGTHHHHMERGLGSWHVEWFALPLVFQTAAAVVASVDDLLKGVEVNTTVMAERVNSPIADTAAIDAQIDEVARRFEKTVGR